MKTATPTGFGFEVFGKVQGVFFRKYTQQKAQSLGLVGWVQNDKIKGTVVGEAVAPPASTSSASQQKYDDDAAATKLKAFEHFLQNEGSPQSRIDRVQFRELTTEQIDKLLSTKAHNNEGSSFMVRNTSRN